METLQAVSKSCTTCCRILQHAEDARLRGFLPFVVSQAIHISEEFPVRTPY